MFWFFIHPVQASPFARWQFWYYVVPVRRFPSPVGQFVSVTYPRRTGRKRLDKNRMRMRALQMTSMLWAASKQAAGDFSY